MNLEEVSLRQRDVTRLKAQGIAEDDFLMESEQDAETAIADFEADVASGAGDH